MKVLLLSPYPDLLLPALSGDNVISLQEKITSAFVQKNGFEMGVSFGYRHILKPDVLAVCPFINLHISYLPWNRGADPNLWSWVDNTPKGVTVHYIDEGIDTGDIIKQCIVDMEENETLATSYDKLQKAIISLFAETWPTIRAGRALRIPQDKKAGSFHLMQDIKNLEEYLTEGYDTPVMNMMSKQGR